ncbi:MAG: FAD-dependent monooxygenase [Candidatus Omnitrophica bacterium]|nr:FAD-dependent monooxygenase [Candidatus Omnitrophota bacterium]
MSSSYEVDVCIVGAGPAGMMLGGLLARQGIRTLVLERHRNFDREFRGEVLMPQFTQMCRQIGIFDFIEKYPHLKFRNLEIVFHKSHVSRISLEEIAPEAPFALWMPQPVLLGALLDKSKEFPNFQLWFNTSAHELVRSGGQVTGVRALKDGQSVEIKAKIVVGADGRASTVRREDGFEIECEEYSFDVMWFSIPRPQNYEPTVRAFLSAGRNYLILPKYPELLQVGLLVPKGELHEYKQKGIESLRAELLADDAVLHDFARQLHDFSSFNVLQARTSFVKRWAQNGCLLVGDSAHTCSPAGAIGVSIAVGTAIVAADVLHRAIKQGNTSQEFLDQVQELRGAYVKKIQRIQNRISGNFLAESTWQGKVFPILFFLLSKTPLLKKLQRELVVLKSPLPVPPEIRF